MIDHDAAPKKRHLTPDDPRHGTHNGYTNYYCRCQPCKDAESAYEKSRRPPSRRRKLLDLIDCFWQRVDKSDDCWLWTGAVNNMGYGVYMIYQADQCEKILAHRFAAMMAGMPVRTPADVVMHSCDTPRCVNPQHLSVGTQCDNMRDARDKGRINISGLIEATLTCRECGIEFRGHPGNCFCPEHKLDKNARRRLNRKRAKS